MLKELWLDLQLFADGGDGGDGGAAPEGAETSGEDIPARIPERAREAYKEAVKKNSPSKQVQSAEPKEAEKPSHIPFKDLIKSDEYKEEHKAYMEDTLNDRLKRYKGIEEENAKMKDMLSIVGNKYGLDSTSETFQDDLKAKVDSDSSYYEDYAMEHNISPEEAKEILDLKRQNKQMEMQRQMQEQEAQRQAAMQALTESAERTKAEFPGFDLDTEMQNEKFRQLIVATRGDTKAAYIAAHSDEFMRNMGIQAAQRAQQQVAQSVQSNASRPIENGISSQASTVTSVDWSKASLDELRAYAAEQRRLRQR